MNQSAAPACPSAPACQRSSRKHPDGRTGTTAGYVAHRTAGEPPCAACQEAHRAMCAARYAARTEQVRAAERVGRNAAADRWRRANPDLARERLERYRDEGDRIIKAAKARPCADCGRQYPSYVMQFDHLRDKHFGIGQRGRNRSRRLLIAEIEKCDVVCANCHAERTYQRGQPAGRHRESVPEAAVGASAATVEGGAA